MMHMLRKYAPIPLWAALLVWCAVANVSAQENEPLYVENLAAYQRRIEGLINERLNALIPSGKYVMRVSVEGAKTRVPLDRAGARPTELPGFRSSAGEYGPGEEKYRVDRVAVRIVMHEVLAPSDLKYIDTAVKILADYRPERGDQITITSIVPDAPAEPIVAAGEEAPPAEEALAPFPPQEPEAWYGLTWQQWLLIGLLAVILLFLFIVLWRVFHMPKPESRPTFAPPPPSVPLAPPRDESAELEEARQQYELERQLDEMRHRVVKRLFGRPELGRDLLASWESKAGKTNNLLHGLGTTIARHALLPHMGRESYQDLEEAVLKEKPPQTAAMLETMREANLFLATQEITKPEVIRPNPFRFLDNLTWGQIAHLIKEEPINVKAIVLTRVKPEHTARILETLPKEMQLEIAVSIGNLHDMPLDMAQSVATEMAEKSRHVPDARLVDIEGPQALVDLMGRTSSETSRYLLDAMKAKDVKLSEEVEKRFFMFETIPLVPEDLLPLAVRTLPSTVVIQALQGADQDLQRKVIMAFPEQARTGLVTALRGARGDQEAIEGARREVVAKFQSLALQGRIDLKQISDAWAAQTDAT